MNQNEFVGSLTQEQTIAFNAVLISQRDQLKAMYDMAESDLVVAQAEIRDGFNSERKAAADAAVVNQQNAVDALCQAHDSVVAQFAIDLENQRLQAQTEYDKRVVEAVQAVSSVAQNAIRERDELISEFGGHPVVQAMKETARIAEKTRRKAELEAELLAMESEE